MTSVPGGTEVDAFGRKVWGGLDALGFEGLWATSEYSKEEEGAAGVWFGGVCVGETGYASKGSDALSLALSRSLLSSLTQLWDGPEVERREGGE